MADRKALIGESVGGVVLHEQEQWTPGSDRMTDPEGRVLALLTEIPAESGNAAIPATRVLHVDAERTDSYTADGSVSRPFKTLQAGLNALAALTPTGSEVVGVLRLAPSRAYMSEATQLTLTLPSDAASARRLAIVGDSVGAANAVIIPPLRLDSPSNASVNFIAMRGICVAASGGTVPALYVKGHASFTGQIRLYVSDMQFHGGSASAPGFYVDAGGGTFGLYGAAHTNFMVNFDNAQPAIRMERGTLNLRGSNIWGGSVPAINLSGSATVNFGLGELTVEGGTNTNLVTLAGTAGLSLSSVYANPRGNGHVVTHSGTGVISLRDVSTGQLPGGGTGGIDAPAGATVLLGVVTKADGSPVPVTVANPALLLRVVRSAQVGYTNTTSGLTATNVQSAVDELRSQIVAQAYVDGSSDGASGSAWNTSAPTSIKAALDRLATQMAAHLGGKVPA